jgi:predicted DNA binding CopG/RHH family protein
MIYVYIITGIKMKNDIVVPMVRVNIFLSQEMVGRLKNQKKTTGVPVAEFVRRAIEDSLEKVKP